MNESFGIWDLDKAFYNDSDKYFDGVPENAPFKGMAHSQFVYQKY